MKELITDPASFFERVAESGSTLRAMAVLLLVCLAYVMQSAALLARIGDRWIDFQEAVVVGVIANFMQPFLVWLLFLIVVWVVSLLLNGRLNFGQFMSASAWALGPLLVTGLSWTAGRYLGLDGVPLPEEANFSGFSTTNSKLMIYLDPISGDTTYLLFRGIGVVFVLLSFYLMAYAVVACSRLDRWQAVIAVAPVALYYLHFHAIPL